MKCIKSISIDSEIIRQLSERHDFNFSEECEKLACDLLKQPHLEDMTKQQMHAAMIKFKNETEEQIKNDYENKISEIKKNFETKNKNFEQNIKNEKIKREECEKKLREMEMSASSAQSRLRDLKNYANELEQTIKKLKT